jgi:hypothetical protein
MPCAGTGRPEVAARRGGDHHADPRCAEEASGMRSRWIRRGRASPWYLSNDLVGWLCRPAAAGRRADGNSLPGGGRRGRYPGRLCPARPRDARAAGVPGRADVRRGAHLPRSGCCTGETVSQRQRTRPGLSASDSCSPWQGRPSPGTRITTISRSATAPNQYLSASTSSSFGVDVAENWQSEYLQFALYAVGTVWLVQRGSPCSPSSCGSADHPSRNGSATSTPSPPTAVEIGRRKLQPSGEALHRHVLALVKYG